MSKPVRPPSIAVQGGHRPEEETGFNERQTSLLPGQVRTPSYIVTMADWAAPGSSVWDEDAPAPPSAEPMHTPLAGYAHEGDVWVAEDETQHAAAQSAGDDGSDPAHVAQAALTELRAQLHESPTTAQAPAQPPVRPAMPRTESEYWGFSTNPNQQRGSPLGSAPPEKPSAAPATTTGGAFTFRVSDGSENVANTATAPAPSAGAYTASTTRVVAPGARPPTLEDERVAHSIIASAGLPLSVTSLLSYIKEGQPHLEQPLPTTVTTGHRNFPNLSEPAPEEMGPGPMPNGGAYGNQGMGMGMGMPRQGGGGGGGWTVEGDTMGMQSPYRTAPGGGGGGYQNPNQNMGYNGGGGGGGNMMMGPNQGPYRSSAAGYGPGNNNNNNNNNGGAFAAGRRFQQPTYANVVSGGMPPNNSQNGGYNGGNFAPAAANPMGMAPRGGSAVAGARTKSESEILSDLLHFHANFFPPPPPPYVPVESRRRRAELWYHYASKWDITHRLPPPPRSPLTEMEMEYRMKLPEKTRVPYHGDDWLRQCDLWFRVVQSLFDYPEENITVETELNVVLEHAVLS